MGDGDLIQMITTKHTPGPWTVGDSGLSVLKMNQPDPDYLPRAQRVADVYQDQQFSEESRANAKLVAAAPDLLKACEQVKYLLAVARDHGYGPQSPELQQAAVVVREAISKARPE